MVVYRSKYNNGLVASGSTGKLDVGEDVAHGCWLHDQGDAALECPECRKPRRILREPPAAADQADR